jgi:hypothetical protein
MNRSVATFILALTLLGLGIAHAQTQTRVRGTAASVAGDVLTVRAADGTNVEVRLGEKTNFVFTQPITLAEIKQGDFLAVTSRKGPGGSLTAVDIRRFSKPVNPGHRPLDGSQDQTMTNAIVSAMVQSASSHELVMSYEGGSQKIMVPDNASISTLVPGERSQLLPGSPVSVNAAAGSDGKLVAQSIQFGKPRVEAR